MREKLDRTRVGERITIYPRGKKKIYIADFWQDNVHRKVTLKTANKKIAIERATRIAAELNQGHYRQAPPAVDVRQASGDYVSALKTDGRAPKTLVKYAGVFKIFLAFLDLLRVTKLSQVTGGHFDAYRAKRSAVRHAKTVYSESVIVKQLFKWAKSRRLIADDVLAGIKLNKPPTRPKDAPSFPQVNAMIAAAEGPLWYWLIVLAFTGMRVGELRRLLQLDVDLANNWIRIVSRAGAETKTKDSRKVPIHPRLRAALEVLPASQHTWFFNAGPSRKHPRGGNWINPKRVNDQFIRLVKRLGFPAGRKSGFTVHSLRHFFETFTHNNGIPQRVVDTWLGHSSDKSMAAVYYRLSDEDSQMFMLKVPFGLTPEKDVPNPLPNPDSIQGE